MHFSTKYSPTNSFLPIPTNPPPTLPTTIHEFIGAYLIQIPPPFHPLGLKSKKQKDTRLKKFNFREILFFNIEHFSKKIFFTPSRSPHDTHNSRSGP